MILLCIYPACASGELEQNRLPVNPERRSQVYSKTITAYNLGDVNQNDADPCIGASNEDLCKLYASGMRIFASREFFGKYICVKTVGCGWVKDKTSLKYKDRIDLAFSYEENKQAKIFGKQSQEVIVYE